MVAFHARQTAPVPGHWIELEAAGGIRSSFQHLSGGQQELQRVKTGSIVRGDDFDGAYSVDVGIRRQHFNRVGDGATAGFVHPAGDDHTIVGKLRHRGVPPTAHHVGLFCPKLIQRVEGVICQRSRPVGGPSRCVGIWVAQVASSNIDPAIAEDGLTRTPDIFWRRYVVTGSGARIPDVRHAVFRVGRVVIIHWIVRPEHEIACVQKDCSNAHNRNDKRVTPAAHGGRVQTDSSNCEGWAHTGRCQC